MQRVVLVILFFCLPVFVRAQETIRGYYVNYDGDTITGDFVNFHTGYANPAKVLFRRLGAGGTEVLSPFNCLVFSLRHYDVFVARQIARLTNPVEVSAAVTSIDTERHYQGVTTFLELIFVSHGLKLYQYHDQLRSNFFVEQPDGNFYELEYMLTVKGDMLGVNNHYRGQLRRLFAGEIAKNHKLGNMIEQLTYDRPALLRFFERATNNALGSLRRYQSPDIILSAGAAFPNAALAGMYGAGTTVVMPGIGVVGYARDLKKSFFTMQLSGLLQQFKKTDPGGFSGTVYDYHNYRLDLQISAGRWVYEKDDLHTYLSVGTGFLVAHAVRQVSGESGSERSDFVRPILNVKAGMLLNSNLGFWLSAEPLRLSTGDDGFYFGNFSQRIVALGIEWRLAI